MENNNKRKKENILIKTCRKTHKTETSKVKHEGENNTTQSTIRKKELTRKINENTKTTNKPKQRKKENKQN